MEWVEALVRRHFSEREPALASYTEAMASELGIRRTQRNPHLIPTAMGSFIRPYSCKVEVSLHARFTILLTITSLQYMQEPQQAQQNLQGHNEPNHHVGAFVRVMVEPSTGLMTDCRPDPVSTLRDDGGLRGHVPSCCVHKSSMDASNNATTHFESREDPQNGNSAGGQHTFGPAANSQLPSELTPGMPHRILSQGYTKLSEGQNELGVPPLQHRRTLDHYLYSHLASINRRDRDQVIQKSTAQFGSKMFMVDQLWIWVLDNGKSSLAMFYAHLM
jgi:hypothetical protein